MALMDRPRNPRTSDRQRLHGEREGKQRYAAPPALSSCERKARYATPQLAEIGLTMVREAGRERGDQHVYQCPDCRQYHFGGW